MRTSPAPLPDSTQALLAATAKSDVSAAERELLAGADANAPTAGGGTLLHSAALAGAADIVRLLLHHGAQVDGRDKYGKTPLHCAARQGQAEVARLLIDAGASPNAMAKNGSSPLDWAIKFEQAPLVDFLRSRGGETGKGLR